MRRHSIGGAFGAGFRTAQFAPPRFDLRPCLRFPQFLQQGARPRSRPSVRRHPITRNDDNVPIPPNPYPRVRTDAARKSLGSPSRARKVKVEGCPVGIRWTAPAALAIVPGFCHTHISQTRRLKDRRRSPCVSCTAALAPFYPLMNFAPRGVAAPPFTPPPCCVTPASAGTVLGALSPSSPLINERSRRVFVVPATTDFVSCPLRRGQLTGPGRQVRSAPLMKFSNAKVRRVQPVSRSSAASPRYDDGQSSASALRMEPEDRRPATPSATNKRTARKPARASARETRTSTLRPPDDDRLPAQLPQLSPDPTAHWAVWAIPSAQRSQRGR